MSVSHPLLKQLKGIVYELRKKFPEREVGDSHPSLLPLCQTLDEIFSKGLKTASSTPFGFIKKDYWSWIYQLHEQKADFSFWPRGILGILCVHITHNLEYNADYFLNNLPMLPFTLINAIENTASCKKVHTNIGRGRFFIRAALVKQALQSLVDIFVKDEIFVFTNYDPHTSILGNEILSEILSSLLHELNKIDFKLELKNASFLDDTWELGVYRKFEFVPCKEMGITFAYIKGRIVVVKVEEGSVAAEDNQIQPGDVLDELYGQSLYRCARGLISTLANKYRGMPVYLSVVKGCYSDGTIYPPLKNIIDKLNLKEILEKIQNKSSEPSEEPVCEATSSSLIFNLLLLGRFQVKNGGRAQHIELAINKALELKLPTKEVIMEITERDLKVFTRDDHMELVNKHFSEISACGRKKACPEIFAFIFGNTTCTIADEFHCFVLEASSETAVSTILSSVAHGFVKTHWEV